MLYRVSPLPGESRLWAELRILREPAALGKTIYAQPQLISYKGQGTESQIDAQVRKVAEAQYGIKIPR